MESQEKSRSAEIRARLNHPIVDSDGHLVEFMPLFRDYLKAAGGPKMLERLGPAYATTPQDARWYKVSPAQRRELRTKRTPFWGLPAENTLDLATAVFPRLLYERLDEFGLDFAVLYPSLGLTVQQIDDEEVRRAGCRALNNYYAEVFGEFQDRMTPVAVIPMHTPGEAIEELDYAVGKLGHKAVLLSSFVKRPVAAVAGKFPQADRYAFWLDTYGIDSDYDYDPVWTRCLELGVAPTFHSSGEGWGSRNSISNYVYNHIGHFAASAEAVSKSLVLGGVTRRFPQLRFSFLEGGVGWARTLLADLIGHWKKRNKESIAIYNPARANEQLLADLSRRYGGKVLSGRESIRSAEILIPRQEDPEFTDDFARCQAASVEDFRKLFIEPFYFGCEADDPITASAFDVKRNPLSAPLNAIYGSDIGHFDVPDMRDVSAEAYEPVEEGWISEDNFRAFVFDNPVRMWTALNPDFFKGTVVESAVARFLTVNKH